MRPHRRRASGVLLTVDGREIGRVELKRALPAAFTASETLDIGLDLGSTVSLSYFEKRPFQFAGKIHAVNVRLK